MAATLHPIRALEHVISEYRDYLQTEFRAKDANLRAALEQELDAQGFLAQEPFYQAHRPFVDGRNWSDLSIEPALARVMEDRTRQPCGYLHQTAAIDELLSDSARPVVVTTGTGSGKTESFLLPVIQNAFEDVAMFPKSGLTAILIYPMNALANDQKLRIEEYLSDAGFGNIKVQQYDRSTSQKTRQEMRANPPHILLTNYMMLEYLLVRPADRDNIFANHRCRYLVLDEVHSYRGILGSNIALLTRRLRAHLERAQQDWNPNPTVEERPKRFPSLVPVGTSATIKSFAEDGLSREEVIRLRDEAVQEFFGTLTGADRESIVVLGEELKSVEVPNEASYPATVNSLDVQGLDVGDPSAVEHALSQLSGIGGVPLEQAARSFKLLWELSGWLTRRPMSISQIVEAVRESVPERADAPQEDISSEVEAALTIGAALPDGTPGALRLRAHRFLRGGWKFHRCINPDCGRLYPMGEERCGDCGHQTAPLYLCRNCGADYLALMGDPDNEPLRPRPQNSDQPEWMLYEPRRFNLPPIVDDDEDDDDTGNIAPPRRGQQRMPAQIRGRQVRMGSVDPTSLQFSNDPTDYRMQVTLAPARTRCLCCGGTAGSRSVLTPVALGTSAAVKVIGEGLVETLAEANAGKEGHDGKERLLVFSDSRQDAAHQARFVIFASRYDRMRRRLVELLESRGALRIQEAVEALSELAVNHHDNPYVPEDTGWLPDETRDRISVWEEAPLLDELAVNAGYRGTLFNLGLVAVRYNRLDEYVQARGEQLAGSLGINLGELEYVSRVVLDEMRTRGALSRQMLQYHPGHIACPQHFQRAEWERRMKQPQGYPLSPQREVVAYIDGAQLPAGIKHHNAWRRPGVGGRGPSVERIVRHLQGRLGGTTQLNPQTAEDILSFLRDGSFLTAVELFGFRDRVHLLQVNSEVIRLELTTEQHRVHCEVCGDVRAGAPVHAPCPRCHGLMVTWPDSDVDQNRHVRRIRNREAIPLVAKEHTAQITTADRADVEESFKAPAAVSPVNMLACSPTLEMGIDVGGLDAVVMRNVPPRPDNYAQRGGRAGRRSRVGIVLGYARSTPHDQYFYDKPREMIAGEVPAPAVSLGNRDVLIRHLYAIVIGSAEPGLAGRMIDYVGPQGEIKEDTVNALIEGVTAQIGHAIEVARQAWGADVLSRANLTDDDLRDLLADLPDRIRYVFDATARQVIELRQALEHYTQTLERRHAGTRAADLVARILGIPADQRTNQQDADDRSAGYPLRRFAEFGLLPGYEFPSEPAALRLLGDEHEEDPISVTRRFGIGQFQPDAHVYARRRRWKVIGLDNASPWNPRSDVSTWTYRVCNSCGLRHHAQEPRCPRCRDSRPGQSLPSYDFAGFLAKKDERPILDEEERYAVRNVVRVYPQWSGEGHRVTGRWTVGPGWALRLSQNEEVRWVNEGIPPTTNELQAGVPVLHRAAKGYLVCPSCGRMLTPTPPTQVQGRGRRNAGRQGNQNNNGHADTCPQLGSAPQTVAITTSSNVEVLRLMLPVPRGTRPETWNSFGVTLGFSLLNGIRHHFMLDAAELDFEIEGPWEINEQNFRYEMLSLAFIDPSLGGSGYLNRVAQLFHLVAQRTLEHLDHPGCDSACYRCLKAYHNQRYHDELSWPQVIPALDELAAAPPEERSLETGDLDDPSPWLAAYRRGVGSPLEAKFLDLFEEHGFHPAKQVPMGTATDGSILSVADFAVPDRRLAIYIDGAAFHDGDRSRRRDRFIRERLRNADPPWHVEELRARNLQEGRALVERLKNI